MTTFLRTAPDEPAGRTGTAHPTGTLHRTGTAHPTGTAEPAGRRTWLSRLLAVSGPAAGSIGMAFGAPVGSYVVAAMLHRDRGRTR